MKELLLDKLLLPALATTTRVAFLLPKGKEITEELLSEIPSSVWGRIKIENETVEDELSRTVEAMEEQVNANPRRF